VKRSRFRRTANIIVAVGLLYLSCFFLFDDARPLWQSLIGVFFLAFTWVTWVQREFMMGELLLKMEWLKVERDEARAQVWKTKRRRL
jgi:hypothetical protein